MLKKCVRHVTCHAERSRSMTEPKHDGAEAIRVIELTFTIG